VRERNYSFVKRWVEYWAIRIQLERRAYRLGSKVDRSFFIGFYEWPAKSMVWEKLGKLCECPHLAGKEYRGVHLWLERIYVCSHKFKKGETEGTCVLYIHRILKEFQKTHVWHEIIFNIPKRINTCISARVKENSVVFTVRKKERKTSEWMGKRPQYHQ
jgi:hypothetical protein